MSDELRKGIEMARSRLDGLSSVINELRWETLPELEQMAAEDTDALTGTADDQLWDRVPVDALRTAAEALDDAVNVSPQPNPKRMVAIEARHLEALQLAAVPDGTRLDSLTVLDANRAAISALAEDSGVVVVDKEALATLKNDLEWMTRYLHSVDVKSARRCNRIINRTVKGMGK